MTVVKEYFDAKKISYTKEQITKLEAYANAVYEQNKVMNLTATKTLDEIIMRHIVDSLTVLECESFQPRANILDLGTGAGFPGVPLAIMQENCEFVLIDSVRKKLDFIERTCNELRINNVKTLHSRIEDIGHDKTYREQFDHVVSRALAPLPVLLEYTTPFIKKNGRIIAFKGKNIDAEIEASKKALEILKVKIVNKYILPTLYEDRNNYFIILNKIEKLPKKYPRKAGTPKKNPL